MVAAEMAAMHVEHQAQILGRWVRVTLPPPPRPLAVMIYWMGEGDDPWVFLEAFRAAGVTVAEWLRWRL